MKVNNPLCPQKLALIKIKQYLKNAKVVGWYANQNYTLPINKIYKISNNGFIYVMNYGEHGLYVGHIDGDFINIRLSYTSEELLNAEKNESK